MHGWLILHNTLQLSIVKFSVKFLFEVDAKMSKIKMNLTGILPSIFFSRGRIRVGNEDFQKTK